MEQNTIKMKFDVHVKNKENLWSNGSIFNILIQ